MSSPITEAELERVRDWSLESSLYEGFSTEIWCDGAEPGKRSIAIVRDYQDAIAIMRLLARLDAETARRESAEKALRPFAEASQHLHPSAPDDGVTLDGLKVAAWRAAAAHFAALTPTPPETKE